MATIDLIVLGISQKNESMSAYDIQKIRWNIETSLNG